MELIQLDGGHLTLEQFELIVREKAQIRISGEALERVRVARILIFELDKKCEKVYGLNTGVGWNKDKKVCNDFFDNYNKSLLRSHSIGISPECTGEEVRGMLLIRLNGILTGHTGVSEEIVRYLVEFLNKGIHPVVKKRGSIGEGDIGTLSAIGLVMIGEGEAFYKGRRLDGRKALAKAGLTPLILGPKDGLGIVSSNAQSASFAANFILEAGHFLKVSQLVFCLSLEALNGVTAPLDKTANELRGYSGQISCAKLCRSYLKGSYLYKADPERALQDPLSFRDHCAVTGAVLDAYRYVKQQLLNEINATDDNPCLIPEEGRMSGSANFEPLTWVLGIEMLTIGFGHLSKMVANRIIKLANPQFTRLPRFLSPREENVIAFSTIQKAVAALDAENRMYVNPSSLDFLELAGGIEDHGTNAPLAVEKARKLLDNLYYLVGIELMHSAQGVDLRSQKVMKEKEETEGRLNLIKDDNLTNQPFSTEEENIRKIKLGCETTKLYEAFRQQVSYLEEDRNLSVDIQKSYEFIKSYHSSENPVL